MLEINFARPPHALESFQRATRLDPTRSDAWVGIANAAMVLGNIDQAAAAVERATRLTPDAPHVKEAAARLKSGRAIRLTPGS
jgi:cytochrome c-type biogenesis protein CcmH/NrfG